MPKNFRCAITAREIVTPVIVAGLICDRESLLALLHPQLTDLVKDYFVANLLEHLQESPDGKLEATVIEEELTDLWSTDVIADGAAVVNGRDGRIYDRESIKEYLEEAAKQMRPAMSLVDRNITLKIGDFYFHPVANACLQALKTKDKKINLLPILKQNQTSQPRSIVTKASTLTLTQQKISQVLALTLAGFLALENVNIGLTFFKNATPQYPELAAGLFCSSAFPLYYLLEPWVEQIFYDLSHSSFMQSNFTVSIAESSCNIFLPALLMFSLDLYERMLLQGEQQAATDNPLLAEIFRMSELGNCILLAFFVALSLPLVQLTFCRLRQQYLHFNAQRQFTLRYILCSGTFLSAGFLGLNEISSAFNRSSVLSLSSHMQALLIASLCFLRSGYMFVVTGHFMLGMTSLIAKLSQAEAKNAPVSVFAPAAILVSLTIMAKTVLMGATQTQQSAWCYINLFLSLMIQQMFSLATNLQARQSEDEKLVAELRQAARNVYPEARHFFKSANSAEQVAPANRVLRLV